MQLEAIFVLFAEKFTITGFWPSQQMYNKEKLYILQLILLKNETLTINSIYSHHINCVYTFSRIRIFKYHYLELF